MWNKFLLTVKLHKLYGKCRAKDILCSRKESIIGDNKNYIIYNRDIIKDIEIHLIMWIFMEIYIQPFVIV